jgi:hypothetical protein
MKAEGEAQEVEAQEEEAQEVEEEVLLQQRQSHN